MRSVLVRLWKNFPTFLVIYLFMLLPPYFVDGASHIKLRTLVTCLAPQPLLLAVLLTLLASASKYLKVGILIIAFLIFSAELFCYFDQSTRISCTVIIIALQSDIQEASSFLSRSTSIHSLLFTISTIAAILLLFLFLDKKWSRLSSLIKNKFKQISKPYFHQIVKYGISPIVVVCCIVSGYKCYYLRQRYFTDYWEVRADNICITAPISYVGFIEKVLQWASPEKFQRIEKALDNVVVNEATVDSLHIVYVIGESCIKDRLGVYGYFLDTTPFIQQEFDRGNIVLLNDVVTPTPQTVVMMPRLMTVADIDNTPDINDYPLLPGVLKKGGYYVEYYDNQSIKKTTAAFDYACNSFMMKPSIQRKAVDSINDTKFRYDMDLVHNYKVAMDSCRTFTIYHLWGQHLEKEMVCDPELARVEAEDYSAIPEYDQTIRQRQATYDNKILETDKTIQLIIEQLRESIALLVFVPDHGEEMFDSRMSFGRTIGDHSLSALRSAHNVPAFIWLSDSYIAKYPDIKDRLQAAADKKIYNCDIPFTILDLSTVGTPEISRHPSLLNPSPGRKARILDDTFNYDAVEDDVRKLRLYYSGL